tara:strand:+ start:63 stop:590 length:528 start_codon:yes stop_codon:yes gene_type:complete
MSKIVYILTNQSMPDTIKIGITDNLERRIRELDNTSTPLPFECYYAVEVENASDIEKKIHDGLDDKRVRNNREFFNTTPEQAKSILEIAEVMGGKNDSTKKRVIDVWEQFKGISKFPNIKICDDPKKIGSLLKEFKASKKNIQRNEIDRFRNKVVFSDGKKFSFRILNKISYILS